MNKHKKPSEALRIGYLYGEISPEEKIQVAQWLEGNPEAKAEMQELADLQSLLQKSEDEEVMAPEVSFETPVLMLPAPAKKAGGIGFLHLLYAAAASIVLLLTGAWLLGGLFHQGPNYDAQLAALQAQIDAQEQQWKGIDAFATHQALQQLDQKWTQREQALANKITSTYAQYASNMQEAIQRQFEESETLKMLWAGMAAEHKALLEEVMYEGSLDQQQSLLTAILELETYFAVQREQDLEIIANSIDNVAIELDYRQQEAVNALAQLIVQSTQPLQNPK